MDEFKNALITLCKAFGIISKGDSPQTEEERISIEVVYEPDVRDAHNQWMSADTIRKGCENFNKNLEDGVVQPNLFHAINTDKFEIVKSWIHEEIDVTVDGSGEAVKAGTWLTKVHYKDEALWKLKKEDVIQGVSIYCQGQINEETGEITNLSFDGDKE